MEQHSRSLCVVGEILHAVSVLGITSFYFRHGLQIELLSRSGIGMKVCSQYMHEMRHLLVGKIELFPEFCGNRLYQRETLNSDINIVIGMNRYRNAPLLERGVESYKTVFLNIRHKLVAVAGFEPATVLVMSEVSYRAALHRD